ncbi:MAG: hypothetical protein EBT15_04765 [Betaproteobacteria bacterium]|nr:hypothetical protein [Betaproteobacteria bacterium]
MSIRNQNWYNLQSTRRYPLDDLSSGLDDAGVFIRDDILVDCHIRFPNTLGKYLYVQGLTVSAGIVTAVFGVVDDLKATAGQTICAVSVPQPITPYVNYSVTALVPGVSGWVAFGPGTDTAFTGRYSTPKQTVIQPRNARPYRPLPIPTLGKIHLGTALQGVVNLVGSSPVTAQYETIEYENKTYPAIVFRLDAALVTGDYNPLALFLGPCGQRPESGTCPKTPIETINGVAPDCNGNINIVFDGFNDINFANCGGADIVTDTSLKAVCDANKPKRPQEFKDLCCTLTGENIYTFSSLNAFPPAGETNQLYLAFDTNKVYRWSGTNYVETDIVIDEYCWPDPTTAIDLIVDETLDTPAYACMPLPLCIDFSSCQPNAYFVTQTGVFAGQETTAPPVCGNCDPGEFDANIGTGLTNHGTYVSAGIGGTNVAILKNCATDWALNHSIMTEFKIGTNGVARNGGLVLNYTQTLELGQVVTRYIVVMVDATRGKVRVMRYNDGTFTDELAVNYNAKVNTWYRMYASLNLNGSNLSVTFSLSELDGAHPVNGFTDIINPGDVTGAVGLFANQSSTFFNKFVVQ